MVQEDSYHSRSADRPESAGRTTPVAQRKQPKTLKTQEPRGSREQESSDFHVRPELIVGHRATYKNIATRDLVPHEYLHTCIKRENWSLRNSDKQSCRKSKPVRDG